MIYLAIVLISVFIIKDVIYFNDPYIMRGISQLFGLIGIIVWAFSGRFSVKILLKYWVYWCYIISLLISSLNANNTMFVFLQVISLFSIILFFIAFYESSNRLNKINYDKKIFNISAVLIGLITVTSLILYKMYPALVIDMNDFRFHGIYGKSGMMASISSILIGIALLGNYKYPIKILLLLPSVTCLILTLSRTFWIASVISIISVSYIYKLVSNKLITIGIILLTVSSSYVYLMDYNYNKISGMARPESISNLTGRVGVWKFSMRAFYEKPLFGSGLTAGSEVLSGKRGVTLFSKPISTGREMSRRTAHNGYIQSLLDSGIVGSIFYIAIIILSVYNIIKYDKEKILYLELYIIIFMAIANIAESMIYASSNYSIIIYWGMSIKSFYIKRTM